MNIMTQRVFISFTKIDHWSIVVKEMRAMGAMFVKLAVLLK